MLPANIGGVLLLLRLQAVDILGQRKNANLNNSLRIEVVWPDKVALRVQRHIAAAPDRHVFRAVRSHHLPPINEFVYSLERKYAVVSFGKRCQIRGDAVPKGYIGSVSFAQWAVAHGAARIVFTLAKIPSLGVSVSSISNHAPRQDCYCDSDCFH